ncbi:GTP-binding protein [Alphaproteobacteria bacterium]|jgi:G3E family GTPase|nr:GTP-binding protein [Alphaproteobacteria bacterium]MDC1086549.1 GTP-binding protein [Alphaproteobacteria bacterium]
MSYFPENISITILTGFLGSGKTTILSSLIKHKLMANAAIIINEFGEIGLDHDLIETTDENVIELQNGCICCTIQGDLKSTLLNLLKKMEKGEISPFNHVIIETTGLADPVPIIHTLMTSLDLQRIYSIDGVITVIDSINGESTYNVHEEAVKQTAFADRIVLSKTDIADEARVNSLTKRIRTINPKVTIIKSNMNSVPVAKLLGLNDYNPQNKDWNVREWLEIEKNKSSKHLHHHHDHDVNRHGDDIETFAMVTSQPVSMTSLNFFLELLMSQMGENILRIKGILNIKGQECPAVIHGVQHIFHPLEWLEKWPSQNKQSRLVFITKNINKDTIDNLFKIIGRNELS